MPAIPTGMNASRTDYSRFFVHLTRDDRADDHNGGTAIENFRAILDQRRILAVRPHCLHGAKIELLDKRQQRYFQTACFTEAPLDQIRHLSEPLEGRSYELEPFGFVFQKESLLRRGAQQTIPVNGYGEQSDVRRAFDRVFKIAQKSGFTGEAWRMLPFVNAMHGGYDFTWEREWRLVGDFAFELADLVCVILPPDRYSPLKHRLDRLGIAVISPEWGYEQVVAELARQKRSTRSITRIAMSKACSPLNGRTRVRSSVTTFLMKGDDLNRVPAGHGASD
jgi:hypothetical protein